MRYYPKLKGERIYLSPINPDDVAIYTRWFNDMEVTDNLGNSWQIFSETREAAALEDMARYGHNFAIVKWEKDELIGNVSLMDVNNIRNTAECGIFIGEAENRTVGYGVEALELLLRYGFDVQGLHNIMLKVFEFNEVGIACYKKVGFQEIGRRRKSYRLGGKFYDEVYMDIVAEEFRATQGEYNLLP